jgi:MFS family permease
MFAALRVLNFRRYVAGQSLSLLGTWVETVAQALLVLQLTHSGTILGLTTAARYAPVLLTSPYAGLLVDRLPKRGTLLVTQAGLGVVSAVMGISVLANAITIWRVVVLGVVFGLFTGIDNPARQAFVQQLVGRDLLRNAVVLNSTTVNVARLVGPIVAAALVSTVGIGWCFIVNAISFGFVIASLVNIKNRTLYPIARIKRAPGQFREGLRYAASNPELIRPLLMMAAVGTLAFEFEVSLPLLAEKTFHGSQTTYSWLIGGLGAGAVAGRFAMARSGKTGVPRLVLAASGLAVALTLVAIAPTVPAAVAACVPAGAAFIAFLTTGNSTIQLASAPEYHGRITALWSMALVGSTPIGSPIVGSVSDATSPRVGLLLGVGACVVAVAIGCQPAPERARSLTSANTES